VWWIGGVCARGVGSLLNICYFITLFAHEVWSMVFGMFGLAWVMAQSVLALMECWKLGFVIEPKR